MATTVDRYLEAICPTLYNSDLLSVYVDIATDQTSVSFFDTQYQYAIALCAAHNFTIDRTRSDGTGGAITGKSDGRVSINYWNSSARGDTSGLNQTTYGQRLKALIKSMGSGISIGSPDVF